MSDDVVMNPFDVESKSSSWHTAFYYFAEHIRTLSRGCINHKRLYSYVGTNGHYVNHENPYVRKRTAASLSRLVHSHHYADDLRANHQADHAVFSEAANQVLSMLREEGGCADAWLKDYLMNELWADVQRGLANERDDGRTDLSLARVANEMDALFEWARALPGDRDEECCHTLLTSYFHLLAYGYLDERFVYALANETPLVLPAQREAGAPACADSACLIRYADGDHAAVSNVWKIEASAPFTIGRYTDCDAIEADPGVSRQHCRIFQREGAWWVEDLSSRHGTCVVRGDATVYDSQQPEAPAAFKLRHRDRLVLADSAQYWFGIFCG